MLKKQKKTEDGIGWLSFCSGKWQKNLAFWPVVWLRNVWHINGGMLVNDLLQF